MHFPRRYNSMFSDLFVWCLFHKEIQFMFVSYSNMHFLRITIVVSLFDTICVFWIIVFVFYLVCLFVCRIQSLSRFISISLFLLYDFCCNYYCCRLIDICTLDNLGLV